MSFVTAGPEDDVRAERYAQLRDGAADQLAGAPDRAGRPGFLAFAKAAARSLFGIGPADIGRPIQDLEVSYRPLELRGAMAQALEGRARGDAGAGPVEERQERADARGGADPADSNGGRALGVSITFTDVTELSRLTEQFEVAERQLETAYEELQSTVEELETTNEELQSTNEELETTNEELQSTNEELETMNEELQSTNDELEVMNEQQNERADEVDRLNIFLEGILGNLGVGVAVLDPDQTVRVWNSSATELWGLRGDEVGRQALPQPRHRPAGGAGARRDQGRAGRRRDPATITIDAVNRRGRRFSCRVRVLPLFDRSGGSYGVILLMSGAEGDLPGGASLAGPS